MRDRMEETDPSYQYTIAYDESTSEISGHIDKHNREDKVIEKHSPPPMKKKTTVWSSGLDCNIT